MSKQNTYQIIYTKHFIDRINERGIKLDSNFERQLKIKSSGIITSHRVKATRPLKIGDNIFVVDRIKPNKKEVIITLITCFKWYEKWDYKKEKKHFYFKNKSV